LWHASRIFARTGALFAAIAARQFAWLAGSQKTKLCGFRICGFRLIQMRE
jgi:hypothetical protein